MAVSKLTKRFVERVPISDRAAFFWDAELKRFGVKVSPTGTKSYLVQYRMGGRGATTKRYTIGKHGPWNVASAREEAERLLRLVDTGVDPRQVKKDQIRVDKELNFAQYARRFLEEYGIKNWRARNYAIAESNMRRWIIPVLGSSSLPNITRKDIVSVLDRVPGSSSALPRSLFALIRKLFNWAVERGDIERSPIEAMRGPAAPQSRDRVLSDEELWFVILCSEEVGEPFCTFIRLLILTGQRREEVAGMKWNELDRHVMKWSIPSERSKNRNVHDVPLSEIACSTLDRLAGGTRWPKRGYVLTTTGSTPISGYSKAKARLDRIVADVMKREIPAWRLHDLRRTFATNMQRLGVRFEVVEALLNHKSGAKSGVAGVYQRHEWSKEKTEAIEAWTDRLRTLIFKEGHGRYTDGKSSGLADEESQKLINGA
jgi:integrase